MNFHKITTNDIANGRGVRVVLWVSGCNHKCKECHNPQTWDINSGIPFTENDYTTLYKALDKPYIDGITFSGGDPLHPNNRETVYNISTQLKKDLPSKTQWLYTGYSWEDIYNLPIMNNLDVLVDGEFKIDLKDITLLFKGSSNQRLIDVQATIKNNNEIILWQDKNICFK